MFLLNLLILIFNNINKSKYINLEQNWLSLIYCKLCDVIPLDSKSNSITYSAH